MARSCNKCGSTERFLARRRPWQRVLGYVLPVRPYECESCRARHWGLIAWPNQRAPWLSSVALLTSCAVAASLAVKPTAATNPQGRVVENAPVATVATPGKTSPDWAAAKPVETERAPAADVPAQMPSASGEPAVPAPAANAAPISESSQQVAAEPTTASRPLFRPLSLQKPAWNGSALTVEVVADGPISDYRLSRSAAGFVVDLNGKWRVDESVPRHRPIKGTRAEAIATGQHADFFRIVLQLRDPAGEKPEIAPTHQGLTITLHGSE